jgi:hypothetical protein
MTSEEIKGRLMAQVEAAIDALLAKKSADDTITMNEIEDLAVGLGQEVEQGVLAVLVERENSEEVSCSTCGGKMQYKGTRRKQVVSQVGEVSIARAYYYCPDCKSGVFPPG